MNIKLKIIIILMCLVALASCNSNKEQNKQVPKAVPKETLKVLSLNTWHQTNRVEGGFQALINVILQTKADIIMLCEITNQNNVIFSTLLVEELKKIGVEYHSFNSGKSPIVLSKFPILATPEINSPSLVKCIVNFNDTTQITVYAAHLDYTHYACYLPRGYDGITWKKLPEPVIEVDKILEQNLTSQRDEAINLFVKDAVKEVYKGNLVLLAGDFNEPSHLDWTEATKDMYDHNGVVIPWHNSVTLQKSGYMDAYRVKYPDPVTHPGFTWEAYNKDVEISSMIWTPEADDRDRIDFIYYKNDLRMELDDVIIVGPSETIVKGQVVDDGSSEDKFLKPKDRWPSDHKGVLATFIIRKSRNGKDTL